MNFAGALHQVDDHILAAHQSEAPSCPEAFSTALLDVANTMTKAGTPFFVPDDTDNIVIKFVRELRNFVEIYSSESTFGRGVQQRLLSRLNDNVEKLLCPYAGIGMPSKVFPITLPDETVCMNRLEPLPDSEQFDRFRCRIRVFLQEFEIAQHAVSDDVVMIYLFHIFMGCAKSSTSQFNQESNMSSESINSQNFAVSHPESLDNKGIGKDYFRLPLHDVELKRAQLNCTQ